MILLTLLSFPPPKTPISNPNPISPAASSGRRSCGRLRCGGRRSSGGRPWSSNAEPDEGFWKRGKEKRRWWSDDGDETDDDVDDEFDDAFGGADLLEEPWERIWIFKVFKSYGYLLPAIIASMLLATGPKAFLMALALPLGQSAISLAIEKIWGKERNGPRVRPKTRRQPFARSDDDVKGRSQEENNTFNRRQSYQSWVSSDGNVDDKGSGQCKPNFGGWDELDNQGGYSKGYKRRQPPKMDGGSLGRLWRKGRYREVPLFMRLLVAVFPFLGSWFRIL